MQTVTVSAESGFVAEQTVTHVATGGTLTLNLRCAARRRPPS
jgi:hypothetical protein